MGGGGGLVVANFWKTAASNREICQGVQKTFQQYGLLTSIHFSNNFN